MSRRVKIVVSAGIAVVLLAALLTSTALAQGPMPRTPFSRSWGSFGSSRGSYYVEYESAANMKRTWVSYGIERDWLDPEQGAGHEFLHEAVQVKNIWVPTGA